MNTALTSKNTTVELDQMICKQKFSNDSFSNDNVIMQNGVQHSKIIWFIRTASNLRNIVKVANKKLQKSKHKHAHYALAYTLIYG